MTEMRVRQALLADVYAITDCYCSNVEGGVFTRRNSDGTRTVMPYQELGLAERYMNGGAWMSVETCAVWLAHLLRHDDCIPLVVEADGVVVGEAEAVIGHEPAPYGKHIHITSLCIHAEAQRQGYGSALVNYIKQMASVTHAERVTVNFSPAANEFLTLHGFRPLNARRQIVIPARQGRVFYKATDITEFNPTRIKTWAMPIGRYHNARHEWDKMLPGFWNGIPELVEPKIHRLEIAITNQNGLVWLEEDRYVAGRANVALWTERPITAHMVSAIRDRAAQLGYQELSMYVDDATFALTETEATDVRDAQVLLAHRLT